MYTLLLEIKTETHPLFYNPAVDECKAYPRTMGGVEKAIKKFSKFISERKDSITGAQILLYEGHYEYWKGMEPIQISPMM